MLYALCPMLYPLCPVLHASAWRKAVGALRFIAFSWAIGYGKRADLARWMRPKSAHLNPPASL